MAQNLTINGVTYSSVTSLSIPKSAGGNAVFPDTSDANAATGDIALNKTAYVNGVKITGTGTGSGGGNYQSKSVTYTSNGTDTVTPDAGYDALSEVNVTVDVSGGGGGTLTNLQLSYDFYSITVSNIVFEYGMFSNSDIYFYGDAVFKECYISGCSVWCSQSTYDSIFDPLNNNSDIESSQFNIM